MKTYKNKNKLKFRIITGIIPNSDTKLDAYQCAVAVQRFFKVGKIEGIGMLPNKLKHDADKYLLDGTSISMIDEDEFQLLPSLEVADLTHVNKKSYITANPEGETSMLLPAPSFQSEPIARQLKSESTDKHIWCTGTLSEAYYKNTIGGKYAKKLHEDGIGALLIEIHPDKTFRVHKLQYKNGKICFLKWAFSFNQKTGKHIVKEQNVKAVIPGDEHPDELDLVVFRNNQKLVNDLGAKAVYHHDWFNGTTITHHAEGNTVLKNKIFRNIGILEDEIKLCSDIWADNNKKCPKAKHYYVRSNHPEHLDKYLDQTHRHDYVNYHTVVELNSLKINSPHENEFWHHVFGKYNKLNKTKNKFLSESDLHKIGKFICSEHGMDGNNGARGSLRALDKYLTVIIGHSHSPREGRKGSIQVGTSTHLVLNYTSQSGTSTWSHAIAYVNENDTANLLIAVNGIYTKIL